MTTNNSEQPVSALLLKGQDDVANVLAAANSGQNILVACRNMTAISLACVENIPKFHKLALRDITMGSEVVRDGYCIGRATQNIQAGGWVHIHNIQSCRVQNSNVIKETT